MWPVDEWVLRQLPVSHRVGGRLFASVNGSGFVVPLNLQAGGTVRVDGAAAAKRTLSCTVAADITDPAVDPLTTEIRAQYGIWAPNGDVAWTTVGTFVITHAVEAARGLVQLTGVDRYQRIIDARLETPVVTSGVTADAIADLVDGADYRLTTTTTDAPGGSHRTSLWERDRTEAVQQLARSIGAELVFDPEGTPVLRPVPTLADSIAWQIGSGYGGAKVSSRQGVSRDRTYNSVVVIGEPPDQAPVYAVARDEGETSPTRWGGPFGKRTRFMRSQLITTTAQAQAAADAMLSRTLGVARTVTLEVLPHPGLDQGDVVMVEVAPTVWQRHIVQAFTLPLGAGTVALDTRSTAEEVGE